MKDLILEIRWEGLGDHLLWTPLPRIAKQFGGFDRVFLSSFSKFRSKEIIEFVWDSNPYVDGFIPERGVMFDAFGEVDEGMNVIDMVMLKHNIDDGKRWHEPELYFRPSIRKDLMEAIVYDPNYIANAGTLIGEDVEKFIKEENIKISHQMKVLPYCRSIPLLQNIAGLYTPTLKEFCSILVSCKKIICLTTGTATLAAALHKSATVIYKGDVRKMAHHSLLHKYICLT